MHCFHTFRWMCKVTVRISWERDFISPSHLYVAKLLLHLYLWSIILQLINKNRRSCVSHQFSFIVVDKKWSYWTEPFRWYSWSYYMESVTATITVWLTIYVTHKRDILVTIKPLLPRSSSLILYNLIDISMFINMDSGLIDYI